jgi:hypothetical protein
MAFLCARGAPWSKRFAAVLFIALAVAFSLAPSKASAVETRPMHCDQGVCSWGYNYLSPNGIFSIYGTWNYWLDQYIDKTSGGTISHGFNTSSPPNTCYAYLSGVVNYYDTPNHIGSGCGGYLSPFAQYYNGNSSYMYMYDIS